MCRSMVGVHSVTAEIRRAKKRKREEETTGQNIISVSATHNYRNLCITFRTFVMGGDRDFKFGT